MIIEVKEDIFQALKDIETRLKKAFEIADSFDRNRMIKVLDNHEELLKVIKQIELDNE
jgi:hypothetical protein